MVFGQGFFSFGQNSHENSNQRGKVTNWVAKSGHGLISPTFFNETISSEQYLHHNCGKFWPTLSPNLNPCDFFLWGFLKDKLFPQKPSNEFEMREMLIELCKGI
jgi:hypothetical protein